jgi:Na+-transporting NADH:ubiquinone oxidoreductase subunit A
MSDNIKIKRGFDINLAGKAEKKIAPTVHPNTFAIKTTDFLGLGREKLLVGEGDKVKAGTPLYHSKKHEKINITAPVSGEVVEIVRGEKRKLLEIRILADSQVEFESFQKYPASDISGIPREVATEAILRSGSWANIIQRPFAVVANPDDTPKAIFISAFDSSPLAPDYNFIFKGEEKYFQAGLTILKKFTSGNIHLGINGNAEVATMFTQAQGVKIHKFSGPHPAGNVGVHIHHINPINKNDIVWTVNPFGVIQIGKLFLEGVYDTSRVIAVAGSEIADPQYYRTHVGANIEPFVKGKLKTDNVRFVSGNVLTGEKIPANGYLGFYHNMLTVIKEGNTHSFLGWILPTNSKPSFHKAFGLFSFLNSSKKEYIPDTNTNGEERPFVQTGVLEKVLPMDIYPVHLLKAILAKDYDAMEALGIYEVAEEDFALCEFVDVSKNDIQAIVREGIDLMQNS